MGRVLLIARNTVRGILSKRALYIWAAAVVLMFLRSAPAIFNRSDDERLLAFLRANAISGSLEVWALLCIASAIFLGAVAVASEIASKTIVTVLARPIRRWELLLGKWLGILAFCVVTLGIGVALAMALARYLVIDVDLDVLGIAMVSTVAGIVLYGGVATALSASSASGVAAALTILLAFMQPLINMLLDDPGWLRNRVGVTLDYVVLPPYQGRYNGVTWAPPPLPRNFRGPEPPRRPPSIDYAAERQRSAQQVGYAGAYFLLGCALFSKRDLKLG